MGPSNFILVAIEAEDTDVLFGLEGIVLEGLKLLNSSITRATTDVATSMAYSLVAFIFSLA